MSNIQRSFSEQQLLVELPSGAAEGTASIWISIDEGGTGRWTGVISVPGNLTADDLKHLVLRSAGVAAYAVVTRVATRDWELRIGVDGRGTPPVDLSLVPTSRWRGQEEADDFLRANAGDPSDPDGLISAIVAAIAAGTPGALVTPLEEVSRRLNELWATHDSPSVRLLAGQAALGLEHVRLSFAGEVPDLEAVPSAEALATLVAELLKTSRGFDDQSIDALFRAAALLARHARPDGPGDSAP